MRQGYLIHKILNGGHQPSAGGFDPDAAAFFTAIEPAGGTLSDTTKEEWNALILREKAAGRYSKIKRLYPYLGGVINSAIIDAISLGSATNNNFIDGDCDTVCGLTSDGSTKWLITDALNGFLSSSFDMQEGHLFFTAPTSTSGYWSGVTDGTYTAYMRFLNPNDLRIYHPTLSDVSTTIPTLIDGEFYSYGRYSSSSLIGYANNIAGTNNTNVVVEALPSIGSGIFARNVIGSPAFGVAAKLGCSYYAETMTEAELLAFQNSYKTFINNITA